MASLRRHRPILLQVCFLHRYRRLHLSWGWLVLLILRLGLGVCHRGLYKVVSRYT